MLNAALAIIHDEHRSLAAVIQGLRFLVHGLSERSATPDFKLLWAMILYLDEFPEKLHQPKENAYIFSRLRQRTHEADSVVTQLEQQHLEGAINVRGLERALGHYEAGMPDGLIQLSAAVEKFAEETLKHMALEEKTAIPLAKKYLTTDDWVEIALAFGENGDPRFDAEADHEFQDLFSRIVNLAPPPIGVGPSAAK